MSIGSSEAELLDVLRPSGLRAGHCLPKNRIHQEGLWHGTVHLWIYDKTKGLLCQKRADSKSINPGLWDFSAAGHIGAGESHRHAAIRELSEEVNLVLPAQSLYYEGVYLSNRIYSEHLIDREFNHIFSFVGEIDEAMLRPQREEVAELAFIPLEQLKNEWDHSPQNWVGHSKYYYQWLLRFAETSAIASSKKR